jgi:topoisomerase IV subunit A
MEDDGHAAGQEARRRPAASWLEAKGNLGHRTATRWSTARATGAAPDDPKSFAAMRYTEARLTKFAEVLLAELGQGTVDWTPNFDGTMNEPVVLPARLPHVLLNGATGIAVGMATDIPPHNVREVVEACMPLLRESEGVHWTELLEHLPARISPPRPRSSRPAPTCASSTRAGNGSVKLRARYEREEGEIVVTALPYQVSGPRCSSRSPPRCRPRSCRWSRTCATSRPREPDRLVIEPRSNRVDIEALMAHLFATTDLERNIAST